MCFHVDLVDKTLVVMSTASTTSVLLPWPLCCSRIRKSICNAVEIGIADRAKERWRQRSSEVYLPMIDVRKNGQVKMFQRSRWCPILASGMHVDPTTLRVNVSGLGAAQFVAGQIVMPEFVQAQWSNAAAASNGRLQNSAVMQQPGLVVS